MNKRYRIGIKLPWPATNWATFVVYFDQDTASKVGSALTTLKQALSLAGYSSVSDKFLFEAA